MNRKIRFGLYGCNMYRTRDLVAGANAAAGNVIEITACFDIDAAKAEHAVKTFGGRAYTKEDDFLKAPDVDVVLICLPPYLHADAYIKASRAGKDVYLEKPICVDQAGREKIIRNAAEHPVRVYVGLSYRYMAVFRKVAEILRRPEAGKVLGVHHHWLTPVVEDPKQGEANWRHRLDQSGGQLIHHCCHVVDWFCWIGGEIESVTSASYTPTSGPMLHEERELTACFNYRNGGLAVFNLSQHSHQYVQYGSVHAENLGIHYQWGSQSFVRVYKTRSRAVDETYEWSGTNQSGDGGELDRCRLQMEDFITAYLNGAPMSIGLADGIRAFDLGWAARESYQKGQRIQIPKGL